MTDKSHLPTLFDAEPEGINLDNSQPIGTPYNRAWIRDFALCSRLFDSVDRLKTFINMGLIVDLHKG
ncbi:MAG: hypothetical protein COA47_11575 [Robiginitomaculum sp.]|nr:MAG: hypothetical protein COA47_11575 [Robiginitomaculum sp.]